MADQAAALSEALRDRYAIERELGRGGMATVYLARDLKHDRFVAVKVLRPELGAMLGGDRFLREIRLTAQLQHPHILTLLDSGEAAGLLYYVMPYIEGESLRERLNQEGQLSIEEALRITHAVAGALDYAHQRGVIHRDIKPENILLYQGEPMVADFGVALAAASAGGERLTDTGLSLGTPAYMSPEQATAGPKLDGRSDQYSLACVLYEMLTGEPPYTGPTAQAIIAKRLSTVAIPVTVLRPDLPAHVGQAIAKALARTPVDRFATAGEFARQLERGATRQGWSVQQLALLGIVLLAAGAFVWQQLHTRGSSGAANRKMLAVLPFKNLGATSDNYFADGLTEEITSRLASLAGLGVISRTSSERYRATAKSIREIGRELGANYVLEGSVRWEKRPDGASRVRVTPQLIQVDDDSHLWADQIDADLADVFSVQTQIAEQVSAALGVKLGSAEHQGLAGKPTSNLSAYDAYLRGRAVDRQDFTAALDVIVKDLRSAISHYQEAVRLDPTFALAWAKLGLAQTLLANWAGADPGPTEAAARQSITRALQLAPALTDAHFAEGAYRFAILHDARSAVPEFERALKSRPNDAELLSFLATLEWYIEGPKGRSIALAERAIELDPQSHSRSLNLAGLYMEVGRFDDAERIYDQVIGRDSGNTGAYVRKAYIYLLRDGDTVAAQAITRKASRHIDSIAVITAAVTRLSTWAAFGMLDSSYRAAILSLTPPAFGDDTAWCAVAKGYTYRALGDSGASRASYDTAQQVAQRRLRTRPRDPYLWIMLMWTRAHAGRLGEAYQAFDRMKEAFGTRLFPGAGAYRARMAVFAGDYPRALTELEAHDWGADVSVPWLCVDHLWDPLRSHARFQRLVGDCRRGARGAAQGVVRGR